MTGNDDIDYTASRSYFVAQRMLGDNATGLVIGNIGNTELQWETTNRPNAHQPMEFLAISLSESSQAVTVH